MSQIIDQEHDAANETSPREIIEVAVIACFSSTPSYIGDCIIVEYYTRHGCTEMVPVERSVNDCIKKKAVPHMNRCNPSSKHNNKYRLFGLLC